MTTLGSRRPHPAMALPAVSPAAAAVLLILLLMAAAGTAAAAPVITEFSLPSAGSMPLPGGIEPGPDGDLWFTELESNRIGRITTAGVVADEFSVSGALASEFPAGIVQGPDGNLWFAVASGNQIGRITTAGKVTLFNVPTANSTPTDIAVGPDGALWFAEEGAGKIGRITTAGSFKEFTVPTAGAGPLSVAAGPDGNIWFTEFNGGAIGRVTTAGVFKEFALPNAAFTPQPGKIVSGPDGNLWFTELGGDAVGRITTAGTITLFSVPTSGAEPAVITAGPDGNLWFTEIGASQVARITTAGQVAEYAVPTSGSNPGGITAGPDGNIWFTELSAGKIGRLTLAGTGPCVLGANTLCIDDQTGDKRFKVTASYHTAQAGGASGSGTAIQLGSLGVTHGGLFWFFAADNPEMMLKVIDACALNQRFWVFYSATTNVGFSVTVTDTRTNRARTYTNQDLTAAPPIQDTAAFTCTTGTGPAPGAAGSSDAPGASAAADEPAAIPVALSLPMEAPAPPAVSAPLTPLTLEVPAATPTAASEEAFGGAGEAAATCASNATALCIDNRFQLQVSYKTAQGGGSAGSGHAIGLSSLGVAQGGIFWFFSADNPEMLVKVINGCALNNHYWLFYAAGTNVGFTVTLTDTRTSAQRTYSNSDGKAAAPVQDTSALSCP